MNTASSIQKPSLARIVDTYSARERALRAGDGTTAHLLDVVLRETIERRRMAQAARRVLVRQRRKTP